MAVRMVQVRHKETGAKTFMADTAVKHFPGYVRTGSDKEPLDVPDGSAFAVELTDDSTAPQASTTTQEA